MKKNQLYCYRLHLYALIISFTLSAPFALAQTIQITGTTTDANGPLAGVSIQVKGTATGTSSNFDGQYTLSARANDTLVFSFLGYTSQTIPIQGRTNINTFLLPDTESLNEVVINAGYYNTTNREKTGSISRVTAKDIETQPVINPLSVIQGRMSGVNITQRSGLPGGSFNIVIRGINSLRSNGNEPLYIVDGVPFDAQTLGIPQVSSQLFVRPVSPLNNINPSDIESIEILKDADATAIYGSRGANGVVLISTKRAKSNKTEVSINSYTSFGKATRTMQLMNTEQYLSVRESAFQNDGFSDLPAFAYDVNGTWDRSRDTDWLDALIGGTALIQNLQTSISGGSEQTKFLLSGSYRKETTVFPVDDDFIKTAFNSSVSHSSKDRRFNLNLSINYNQDRTNFIGNDLSIYAYRLAPNAPALYDANGNLNWENGTFENPLASSLMNYQNTAKNLLANAILSYKLSPSLVLKTSLGYNNTQLDESRTEPSTIYNPLFGVTSESSMLTLNAGERSSWIIEPQLNYSKAFNKHSINIILGGTWQSQNSNSVGLRGIGFSSNALINSISAASSVEAINEQMVDYNYQAIFARFNYTYNNKYILNLTGRRDGSSRFGPGNQFANFGAIGAAWIFSEDKLFKNSSWLSFGKLRSSYGLTGSDQIGDYQFLNTYSIGNNLYDGITGLQPTQLFNPNFSWETNKKFEVATELGFFNDRVFLTAAWFKNRSSNQLIGIPLPGTTGFASIQANLDAVIENSGFELDLQSTNLSTDNFSWRTGFNMSVPRSKLVKFDGLESSTFANTFQVGEPIQIFKSYNYTGIDPDTGTYTFEDYNGDGVINTADRQVINDLTPRWFGGLQNTFTYQNWELDVLFQFVKQTGRNYLAFSTILPGSAVNMPVEILNSWPDNNNAETTQIYSAGFNSQAASANVRYGFSNAAYTDASFVRLKTLSLGYNLPKKWFKSLSGRIYLQGQNLLTFTNYRGADPETQLLNNLPPLRQYTLGFQFSF